MHFDATFWAFAALVIFCGIVIWQKVPAMIGSMLDERAADITKELDDARRMREEAQSLLAEYQRKRKNAEAEAQDIVTQAKAEAERLTAETAQSLEDMIERRTKAADTKIQQAEAQAVAEVRAVAADVAVSAAEKVLGKAAQDGASAKLMDEAIAEVKDRLS